MKRWVACYLLLNVLCAVGCGPKELGPADPSTTPQVNQEDIEKKIQSSMPPDMMKKYGK